MEKREFAAVAGAAVVVSAAGAVLALRAGGVVAVVAAVCAFAFAQQPASAAQTRRGRENVFTFRS